MARVAVTERPSAIVAGQLVLTRDGARMLASALRIAARAAGRNGVDVPGRNHYDAYQWLLAQADLVAEGRTGPAGAADGTPPRPFRVLLPSSGPAPELLTTRQAAEILGVTPRAVLKQIMAGDLPARRYGREWLATEYDVRHAARKRETAG